MNSFSPTELKKLYLPPKESHKGQNGKLTIVGGSKLFHGASLWALAVASRIVDMVFYASIPENNQLTQQLKGELYDFIAIPRDKVDEYIEESDVVLIGPGLPREEGKESGEESTRALTKRLFDKFPNKKWVVDAGSLTEIDPGWLRGLNGEVVLTPHRKEFETLFKVKSDKQEAIRVAKDYNCIILLKGPVDIVCSPTKCVSVEGGNEGMSKGGTGDVLAGLVGALACKNDLFLAAATASFINKKAGDNLYKKVGPYFNASDLSSEIPKIMKDLLYAKT